MAFMPQTARESVDLLFAVFDALPDPVFVKNSEHQLIYGNKAFARLTGSDDFVGKQAGGAHITPEQADGFAAHDRRVFAGESMIIEEQFGDGIVTLAKKTPIRLPDGTTGLVAILMDITSYKASEAKAHAAEAESAAKSQFLANMSHEIRTPLNGVMGMAQALTLDDLTPAQQEKVNILLDSGRTLLAVVNDVLDISKIAAGKMEIVPVDVDAVQGIRRAAELFRPNAEEKGIDLEVFLDLDMPKRMRIDSVRAHQCFNNLLSNAIKFTDDGRVTVSVRMLQGGGGADLLEITISDTGVGMTKDQISRLFSEFSQVDASTTRKFGGTGLGLVISRRLARLMGGDVTVESCPGLGSTFRLTLAVQPASGEVVELAPDPRLSSDLRGRRVLLVDDNPINRKVAGMFLAPFGISVVEAINGQEALDLLAASAFDAVLMDMHMPVMDGMQAVACIRGSRRTWASIPIIMLTANAMLGDRERYLVAGADGYVSKPIDPRELAGELASVLERTVRPQAA